MPKGKEQVVIQLFLILYPTENQIITTDNFSVKALAAKVRDVLDP